MIKNFFKVSIAIVMIATGLNQQTYAQAVEEGNLVFDGYYGFPNLYTSVFKAAYANTGSELDLNVGGAGPFGLRFEYLITDKIGLGLDIGISSSFVSWKEEDFSNDLVSYDYSTRKIGALVCFNYHFLDNDKFDLFSTVGVGYSSRSFNFSSTDSYYEPITVSSIIPVGFKGGLGMRYFFTDNIGANLQLGFGHGGILNGGLTFKI
jgi:outer membrane protein W